MGNNSSRVKTLQESSTKKVATARQDESEDDDSDATDSNNIQLEVETYECLNGESEAEVINLLVKDCKSDHTKYTPVEDLYGNMDKNASLQLLPEAIRHESVLEFIKIHEKLVVRIRTSVRGVTKTKSKFGTGFVYLSSDKLVRNTNCDLHNCSYNNSQVHENYGGLIVYTNQHVIENHEAAGCCNVDFFYYNEKSLIDTNELTDFGSSQLESHAKVSSSTEFDNNEQRDIGNFQLDSNDNINPSAKDDNDEITDIESCLLGSGVDISSSAKVDDEITAAGSIQSVGGGYVNLSSEIDTSEHEFDSNEERNNSSHFINSNGLLQGITAYGLSLRENQKNKDLVGVRILYHDPNLFKVIKTLSKLRMKVWSKIPEEVKQKMRKYAIIISHPHGWPKKISFGDRFSLEETIRDQKDTKKVTTYNAMTCGGSSGAPVVTGHYSYRPFVHKGKTEKTMIGVSYSY